MSEPKCEGCGIWGVAFAKINVTNGVLTLCRTCLDDVNRKNPEVRALREAAAGNYWSWQGDGEDHLESLVCPVLIPAPALQAIIDRADKLQAFKVFVHARLDQMGVPAEFPDGPHTREGFRVGDRFDWLWARRTDLITACKESRAALVESAKMICDRCSVDSCNHDPDYCEAHIEHQAIALIDVTLRKADLTP